MRIRGWGQGGSFAGIGPSGWGGVRRTRQGHRTRVGGCSRYTGDTWRARWSVIRNREGPGGGGVESAARLVCALCSPMPIHTRRARLFSIAFLPRWGESARSLDPTRNVIPLTVFLRLIARGNGRSASALEISVKNCSRRLTDRGYTPGPFAGCFRPHASSPNRNCNRLFPSPCIWRNAECLECIS